MVCLKIFTNIFKKCLGDSGIFCKKYFKKFCRECITNFGEKFFRKTFLEFFDKIFEEFWKQFLESSNKFSENFWKTLKFLRIFRKL